MRRIQLKLATRLKLTFCAAAFGLLVVGIDAFGGAQDSSADTELDAISIRVLHDGKAGQRYLGSWELDRGDKLHPRMTVATFDESGRYSEAWNSETSTFWFCSDGMLYLVSREDGEPRRAFIHPFLPRFSSDRNSLVLTSPHLDHVLKFKRKVH